jgi:transposase-like protein
VDFVTYEELVDLHQSLKPIEPGHVIPEQWAANVVKAQEMSGYLSNLLEDQRRKEAIKAMPRSDQIAMALIQRVTPNLGTLPYGSLTEIAKEFGVSRQRVAQLANYYDLKVEHNRRRVPSLYTNRGKLANYFCKSCNKAMTVRDPDETKGYCKDCVWETYPCWRCDKPVRRRRSYYESRFASGKYHRVYCSRECLKGPREYTGGVRPQPHKAGPVRRSEEDAVRYGIGGARFLSEEA